MVPEGEDGGGARLGAVEIDRYDIRYLISSTDCMLSSRRDSSHLHLISPSLQSREVDSRIISTLQRRQSGLRGRGFTCSRSHSKEVIGNRI